MLARREHSAGELAIRLKAKGYRAAPVEAVLAALQAEGLQSDTRFAETWIRHRAERGYGPVRIRRELAERGIDSDLLEASMEAADIDWERRLAAVHAKRFGNTPPSDYKEQARQSRFLYSRGFDSEQIRRLFRGDD